MTKVTINGVDYQPMPEQPAPPAMTEGERAMLAAVLEKEGMHYGLLSFSAFDYGRHHVSDKRFHQLRDALVKADDEMRLYLEEQGAMP